MAIEVAASGVLNAVAPGPTDTGMLDRFTDGDEGQAFRPREYTSPLLKFLLSKVEDMKFRVSKIRLASAH